MWSANEYTFRFHIQPQDQVEKENRKNIESHIETVWYIAGIENVLIIGGFFPFILSHLSLLLSLSLSGLSRQFRVADVMAFKPKNGNNHYWILTIE